MIVEIGKEYMEGCDFVGCVKRYIKDLYGYDDGDVLFKLIKCEVR